MVFVIMASGSDGVRTPDRSSASSPRQEETPVKSSPSSSSMSPDVLQLLATLKGAQQTDGQSIASRMELKKKERAEHKARSKAIAKDLKKLRQAKSRAHKKTKNASAEELLQALADKAAAAAKKNEVQAVATKD